jgi:hypothetical protein
MTKFSFVITLQWFVQWPTESALSLLKLSTADMQIKSFALERCLVNKGALSSSVAAKGIA